MRLILAFHSIENFQRAAKAPYLMQEMYTFALDFHHYSLIQAWLFLRSQSVHISLIDTQIVLPKWFAT